MTFKLFLRERKQSQIAERFDVEDVKSYVVRYKSPKMDFTAQTIVWADSSKAAKEAAKKIAQQHNAQLLMCETTENFVYNEETRQYIRKPMTKIM